ncbi:MAG TPA: adenylate/guanylate cyclase domain-containing protein [Anaerolineales bacterium]|nr:adenylate/guanylate cyclase domain-containing protein [Anaerolineales bacterium]
MLRRLIRRALPWVARIGIDPNDSDEVRLQKSLLVLGSSMFTAAGALWGILYFLFGQFIAGAIPLSYAIVSSISIVIFHLTRRYRFFLFTQLLLILFLPFLLMIALGGFVKSSAVILWSLLSPLGALLFDEPRRALRWLAAYLVLAIISGFFETHPLASSSLSPTVVTVFFVLNIGTVSAIAIILLAYFVSEKNRLFGLLRIEQVKAENLLLNILPKEIASILKNESRTIADHYTEASIMFADMVGFTPLAARLAPVEMVELLNEAFSFFDSLLDKYDVEKIRTIGDNYMVASGVPRRRPDHAQALVRMALEMRDYVAAHTFGNGQRVNFRIGINSGPLIAGVIGRRKFEFDVWGDAVNIASRMESHGVGGTIQITRATYELIRDEFICEPRGTVNVKGKGEMEVWTVVSEKAKSPATDFADSH